jgi:hypothetical protein
MWYHPDVPLKEYSIQAQFRLPRQSAPSHIHFFKDLAAEMMRLDPFFKIHAYDRSNASELWPLACTDDIPTDDTTVQSYFVHSTFNQQRTSVSTIFRVTSQHSHVEWRKLLAEYTSQHRILIKHHKLDALETTCIGFLAKKHPHFTHLNHFEAFLRDTLPDHTPQFLLRHLKPRLPAGFDEAVQPM